MKSSRWAGDRLLVPSPGYGEEEYAPPPCLKNMLPRPVWATSRIG